MADTPAGPGQPWGGPPVPPPPGAPGGSWGGPQGAPPPPGVAAGPYGGPPQGSGSGSKVLLVVGLVVLGLVLAVVGGAVAIFVLAGGEDELPAAEASDAVQAIVDAADFDDAGSAPLGACPLGSTDALVSEVAGNGAPPDVGDEVSEAYEGVDNAPGVVCSLQGEDSDEGGTLQQYGAGIGSGSYQDELERVFPDAEIEVEEPTSFRGGEVYAYCVRPEEGDDGCGADWVVADEDLAVGFYAAGTGVPTAARAREVLEQLLPDWVDSLAESGPNLLSG